MPSLHRRQFLCAGTLAASSLSLPGPAARAQQAAPAAGYPDKPVRVIVPFPAGGTTDVVARLTLQHLGQRMGQSFVVDNKGGAGGIIGTELAARAEPDGYTLLMNTAGAQTLSPVIYANAGYHALESFAPVAHLCDVGFVVIARPDLPANSLKALMALAKTEKSLSASSGSSMITLITEQFKQVIHAPNVVNVQYKGTAPQVQAVLAGEVDFSFDSFVSVEMVRAGKCKALAVMLPQRAAVFPDVPTLQELGIQNMDFNSWAGLLAPRGTPPGIVAHLAREMDAVMQMPEVLERIRGYNYLPVQSTPEQFARTIARDTQRWQRIVQETGYKVQ